jgi:hypothetical protein
VGVRSGGTGGTDLKLDCESMIQTKRLEFMVRIQSSPDQMKERKLSINLIRFVAACRSARNAGIVFLLFVSRLIGVAYVILRGRFHILVALLLLQNECGDTRRVKMKNLVFLVLKRRDGGRGSSLGGWSNPRRPCRLCSLGHGEPTAFVTRVRNPDGRVVEHDVALSNGKFRPVLDGKDEAASWETLTRKERWEVRGRRALVAIYVMKRTVDDADQSC